MATTSALGLVVLFDLVGHLLQVLLDRLDPRRGYGVTERSRGCESKSADVQSKQQRHSGNAVGI